MESIVSFNLWDRPWIRILGPDGSVEELSICDVLKRAPQLRTIHEISPLVATGIHRLLAAIAQSIEAPQSVDQLGALLRRERFDSARIDEFGGRFADRFDLFASTAPFLQSADIPLVPRKEDKVKTVAYLTPEIPAGTMVTQWRHGNANGQAFCPRCCAGGISAVAAFATSGGAGIKPSINGVPPLYVMPLGESLFHALALSLVTPAYQPETRASRDTSAWERANMVLRSGDVLEVGYLESLMFPARRMRLFPSQENGACSRCGQDSNVLVRGMVFDMGVSRPKGSPPWLDPFAAYHITPKGPVPIRPAPGKPVWRDYVSLFLTGPGASVEYRRPRVVDQVDMLVQEGYLDEDTPLSFRCTGMRTDMKAKVFEWVDSILRVPMELLDSPGAIDTVLRDSQYAKACADDVAAIFGQVFDPKRRGEYRPVRERMLATYWQRLEPEFRMFVSNVSDGGDEAHRRWVLTIIQACRDALSLATDEVGDRGQALARRAQASTKLNIRLSKRRKEWLDEHQAA